MSNISQLWGQLDNPCHTRSPYSETPEANDDD